MKKLLLPLIATTMLVGCSFANGPRFTELETPKANESIIYYIRPVKSIGSGVYYTIYENGKPICKLDLGGYYAHRTTPGTKHIEAATDRKDELIVEAEKGKRHYVLAEVSAGYLIAGPRLREIDEDVALYFLNRSALSEPIKN